MFFIAHQNIWKDIISFMIPTTKQQRHSTLVSSRFYLPLASFFRQALQLEKCYMKVQLFLVIWMDLFQILTLIKYQIQRDLQSAGKLHCQTTGAPLVSLPLAGLME